MIRRFAECVVTYWENREILKSKNREVYVYGVDLGGHSIMRTKGLLLIGWIGGHPIESTILIALYYALQSTGGGFHASTHLRCFISMAVGMILFLFSLRFHHFLPPCLGLALIASILLWRYPLILHPNKRHLARRAQKCVIRSHCITLSCMALLLISILFRFPSSITQAFAFALICGAVSRAAARVQHKSLVFR